MSSFAPPQQPHYRATADPKAKWAVTFGLFAIAVVLLLFVDVTRTFEALGGAWVMTEVFDVPAFAVPDQAQIFIPGESPWLLNISIECAVALIIVPFLGISGALTASGRFSPARMACGALLATVVVAAVNQVRIAAIGVALAKSGLNAYGWWHTVAGSVMTLVGIGIALTILWFVAIRTPRSKTNDMKDTKEGLN